MLIALLLVGVLVFLLLLLLALVVVIPATARYLQLREAERQSVTKCREYLRT